MAEEAAQCEGVGKVKTLRVAKGRHYKFSMRKGQELGESKRKTHGFVADPDVVEASKQMKV